MVVGQWWDPYHLEVGDGVDLARHGIARVDGDDLVVELPLVDELEIAQHLVGVGVVVGVAVVVVVVAVPEEEPRPDQLPL